MLVADPVILLLHQLTFLSSIAVVVSVFQVYSMLRGQAQLPTDEERVQTLLDYQEIARNFKDKATDTVCARTDSNACYA